MPRVVEGAVHRYDGDGETFTSERCHIVEMSNGTHDPDASIARARVEPGVTTRWHRLLGTTERYVVIEGSARVEVGDFDATTIGPGDVVVIPPMVAQRITNTGSTDLIFLAICTPRFLPTNYQELAEPGRSDTR